MTHTFWNYVLTGYCIIVTINNDELLLCVVTIIYIAQPAAIPQSQLLCFHDCYDGWTDGQVINVYSYNIQTLLIISFTPMSGLLNIVQIKNYYMYVCSISQ